MGGFYRKNIIATGSFVCIYIKSPLPKHRRAVGEDADAHLTGFEGTRAIGGVNRCWGYVTRRVVGG